jgi:hypothetical protein
MIVTNKSARTLVTAEVDHQTTPKALSDINKTLPHNLALSLAMKIVCQ